MKYGYVRVSKTVKDKEKVIERHIAWLKKFGAEKIFVETDGNQLDLLLKIMKSGDELHVCSIDRITHDRERMIEITKYLSEHEIKLYQNGEPLNMMDIRLFLTLMDAYRQSTKDILKKHKRQINAEKDS